MENSIQNVDDIISQENDYIIYVHVNKQNGKLYIGQTQNIKSRWSGNGKDYKKCPGFYNAIKKYGWDEFEHIILFDNLSSEMADIIEIALIKKCNLTNNKYGYNCSLGGKNGSTPPTEQTIKKITEKISKKTYQYDLDGSLINSFKSHVEAEQLTGTSRNNISDCCCGRINSAKGYIWSHVYPCHQKFIEANKTAKLLVNVYNLNGTYIKTIDINSKEYTKLQKENIKKCINGKSDKYKNLRYQKYEMNQNCIPIEPYSKCICQLDKTTLNIIKIYNTCKEIEFCDPHSSINKNSLCHGYLWCTYDFIDNMKPYVKPKSLNTIRIGKFDKDMNLIQIYNSITDAAKDPINNLSQTIQSFAINISQCLTGKKRTLLGYKWYKLDKNDNPIIPEKEIKRRNKIEYYKTNPTPGNEENVYNILKQLKSATSTEINNYLKLDRHTLNDVLHRLENKNLIKITKIHKQKFLYEIIDQ